MILPRPDRNPFLAAAAFLGCALVSGSFNLAAKAADAPAPALSQKTLHVVLEAPPEPVIAPRPPMDVLPAHVSREFDIAAYRRELADLRARALAEARLDAPAADGGWDQAWSEPLDLPPIEAYGPAL